VLESQKETFKKFNTRVVSVNLDEPPRAPAAKAFAVQQGFTFAIVLNKTKERAYEIEKAYNVKGTPTSYLIDGKGRVVESHYGPLNAEELQASLAKLPAE